MEELKDVVKSASLAETAGGKGKRTSWIESKLHHFQAEQFHSIAP